MKTFRNSTAFRTWLSKHGTTESELIVRCFKKHAESRGMTYPEALDEALCRGWIDGIRRAHDEDSFLQRFTPRRPRSVWSAVNMKRFKVLSAEGRVTAAGEAAWRDRHPESTTKYSFESRAMPLSAAFVRRFRKEARAWAYYQSTPEGYRKTSAFWVMSAKQAVTRERRLQILIDSSALARYIPLLRR
jgi:uncharacterized protein YdeI (YjbR/CyaY-like superfamily)